MRLNAEVLTVFWNVTPFFGRQVPAFQSSRKKSILKNEVKLSSETVVTICNAQGVTLPKPVRVIMKLRSVFVLTIPNLPFTDALK